MSDLRTHVKRRSIQHLFGARLRRPDLVLTAMLIVLPLACTSMGSREPLDVTLANLNITEVTLFETTMIAKLRITNPNPESLTIDGGSFKLYLEEKKVGTGTTKETFTVDRLDSTVVDVIFHINNASAILRLKDLFENQDKEVSYGVRGNLFTAGTFGTTKLKINKTGRIELGKTKLPGSDEPDLNKIATPGAIS